MDFEQIRSKIQRSHDLGLDSLDDEANMQLLRERSARYAEAPQEREREVAQEVIEVRRAGAALGIPRERVREIRIVRLCLLPHLPPTLPGIFHIRGKATCALDIQPLLGDASPLAHGDRCAVVMLCDPRGDVGLRIDEVIGLRRVYAEDIDDARLEHREFFTAVTRDLLAIVDVSRLLERREFAMTKSST